MRQEVPTQGPSSRITCVPWRYKHTNRRRQLFPTVFWPKTNSPCVSRVYASQDEASRRREFRGNCVSTQSPRIVKARLRGFPRPGVSAGVKDAAGSVFEIETHSAKEMRAAADLGSFGCFRYFSRWNWKGRANSNKNAYDWTVLHTEYFEILSVDSVTVIIVLLIYGMKSENDKTFLMLLDKRVFRFFNFSITRQTNCKKILLNL